MNIESILVRCLGIYLLRKRVSIVKFLLRQNGVVRHETKRQMQEIFRNVFQLFECCVADLLCLAGQAHTVYPGKCVRHKAVSRVFAVDLSRDGSAQLGVGGDLHHGDAIG